jgi:lactoylglutathione lyase
LPSLQVAMVRRCGARPTACAPAGGDRRSGHALAARVRTVSEQLTSLASRWVVTIEGVHATAAVGCAIGWRNVASNQRSRRFYMDQNDFPAPADGFVITHFLVVSDQDRSREFYRSVFDAKVLLERDPVILKVANTWLILNVGGGPTDDKPTVTLTTPPDPDHISAFMNVRVADIRKAYAEWSAKGANFLTEPKDHEREIRAYIRDPDGHLIEVGQTTNITG